MLKLKKLLKESFGRKFGEPLATLDSVMKDHKLGKLYTDKDKPPFKVNEGMKRFKVYVSGESEPLILMGKNEKEVKRFIKRI